MPLVILGFTLMLGSAGIGGASVWASATGFDWNTVKPVWWLARQADVDSPDGAAARDEIVRRLNTVTLSEREGNSVIDAALASLASSAEQPSDETQPRDGIDQWWDDRFTQAVSLGHGSPTQKSRYVEVLLARLLDGREGRQRASRFPALGRAIRLGYAAPEVGHRITEHAIEAFEAGNGTDSSHLHFFNADRDWADIVAALYDQGLMTPEQTVRWIDAAFDSRFAAQQRVRKSDPRAAVQLKQPPQIVGSVPIVAAESLIEVVVIDPGPADDMRSTIGPQVVTQEQADELVNRRRGGSYGRSQMLFPIAPGAVATIAVRQVFRDVASWSVLHTIESEQTFNFEFIEDHEPLLDLGSRVATGIDAAPFLGAVIYTDYQMWAAEAPDRMGWILELHAGNTDSIFAGDVFVRIGDDLHHGASVTRFDHGTPTSRNIATRRHLATTVWLPPIGNEPIEVVFRPDIEELARNPLLLQEFDPLETPVWTDEIVLRASLQPQRSQTQRTLSQPHTTQALPSPLAKAVLERRGDKRADAAVLDWTSHFTSPRPTAELLKIADAGDELRSVAALTAARYRVLYGISDDDAALLVDAAMQRHTDATKPWTQDWADLLGALLLCGFVSDTDIVTLVENAIALSMQVTDDDYMLTEPGQIAVVLQFPRAAITDQPAGSPRFGTNAAYELRWRWGPNAEGTRSMLMMNAPWRVINGELAAIAMQLPSRNDPPLLRSVHPADAIADDGTIERVVTAEIWQPETPTSEARRIGEATWTLKHNVNRD
ncbi:MAG: hypothetical protein AAF747_05335 [Planctomycetota bacterium]